MKRREKVGASPRIYQPSVVSPDARIGTDVVIGAFCYVGGAVIGDGTRIQSHVSVWDGVTLGRDVFVGPGATFTNVRHPRAEFSRGPDWDLTVVEDGASIGARAVVVAPVHIGRYAMVGAGAVVTRDVPANAIVVGSPARIVGWACACGATVARTVERPVEMMCDDCLGPAATLRT